MRGLLLMSVLIGNIAIPLIAAGEATMRRSVQKTLLLVTILNALYVFGIRYAYLLD